MFVDLVGGKLVLKNGTFFVDVINGWPKYFFLKLEFTPCKAEQPLQGMELQEKETKKD